MFRTSGHTYRITLEAWQHSRTLVKVVRALACVYFLTVSASYHNPLTTDDVGVRAVFTCRSRCAAVDPDDALQASCARHAHRY